MVGQRFTCIDCGARSPEITDEGSTLISVKYGWRITRQRDRSGMLLIDARCPVCWTKSKRRAPSGTRE
jgi:hypothetical protein